MEEMEKAQWQGIEMILRAANWVGCMGKSMATLTLEDYCWRKMISDAPPQIRPLNKLAKGEHIIDWLAPSVRTAARESGYQHLLSGLSNPALHITYKAS